MLFRSLYPYLLSDDPVTVPPPLPGKLDGLPVIVKVDPELSVVTIGVDSPRVMVDPASSVVVNTPVGPMSV